MVNDTVSLLEILKDRFGKKSYVAGFSLGATIGAYAAAQRPDLVENLVAVGTDIDGVAAGNSAYDFALDTARRHGNKRAIRQLEAIGPPPHLDAKQFGTRVRWASNFGGVTHQRDLRRRGPEPAGQPAFARRTTRSATCSERCAGSPPPRPPCCQRWPTLDLVSECLAWTCRSSWSKAAWTGWRQAKPPNDISTSSTRRARARLVREVGTHPASRGTREVPGTSHASPRRVDRRTVVSAGGTESMSESPTLMDALRRHWLHRAP